MTATPEPIDPAGPWWGGFYAGYVDQHITNTPEPRAGHDGAWADAYATGWCASALDTTDDPTSLGVDLR